MVAIVCCLSNCGCIIDSIICCLIENIKRPTYGLIVSSSKPIDVIIYC